ncbi:CvpA family protein [uncultured Bacteroides sp.]|uniref:CvpA family protein n=1 Tax=uncultured Bacteroides sp. TaxID=162156 RepID=UPI00260D4B40|nr:CvpA family protein [uncultured Bacteroides sp.]
MTTIDLVIIIVLAIGTVLGFMKGFIKQIISMVGLIAGLLVARALFGVVGEKLAVEAGMSVTFGQILAFILIGVIVPIGLSVVASILTKVTSAVHLGFINRWLGAGIGLIRYGLIVSIAIQLIQFVDVKNSLIQKTTKEQSALYYPMEKFGGIFYPAFKTVANEIINSADSDESEEDTDTNNSDNTNNI